MLSFRPAAESDVEAVMACERAPGYEETVGRWTREEHLAALGDDGNRYIVGCMADGAFAGFVILQNAQPGSQDILLRRIAVTTQGQGIGRALMQESFRLAFDGLGASTVFLRVYPANARGIALYGKVGMRQTGEIDAPHRGPTAKMNVMTIDAETYRARQIG